MEATGGFEPPHKGFADPPLNHLGTSPCGHHNMASGQGQPDGGQKKLASHTLSSRTRSGISFTALTLALSRRERGKQTPRFDPSPPAGRISRDLSLTQENIIMLNPSRNTAPPLLGILLAGALLLGIVAWLSRETPLPPALPEDTSFAIALNSASDLDPIIEAAGRPEVRFALLGESSHGTAEYYQWRGILSQRLIGEKGFDFIAVEGDWEALFRLNQYVRGLPVEGVELAESKINGRTIMATFDRWPAWLWANEEFLKLVEWLHEFNQSRPPEGRVGIYGKDMYGMTDSIARVIRYIEEVDPEAAEIIAIHLACLSRYEDDISAYLQAVIQTGTRCDDALTTVVSHLEDNAERYQATGEKAYFSALQNALAVAGVEQHYHASLMQGPNSWNVRATYMQKTVERLSAWHGNTSRGIVWAHNTHVGDARATAMADNGLINIGHLLREQHGEEQVFIVGFGTYEGSVIAGRSWEGARLELTVPPAQTESVEAVLAEVDLPAFFVMFDGRAELPESLTIPRGHRAKGVVYNPENEQGNYVQTILSDRYDAFIFIRETTALSPL